MDKAIIDRIKHIETL